MALLRYLFDHNQQVIGALMVIILATAALLMMRMVSQDKPAGAGAKSSASDLDLGAIESAFKRVLAAQGTAPTAAGQSAPTAEPSDRDAKIQELAREIDRLTAELSTKAPSSGEGTGFGGTPGLSSATAAPVDTSALEALNVKIAELEGKLTEYEIIEDDIADLSRFKEENAELRGELTALKSSTAAMANQPKVEPALETAAPADEPIVEPVADPFADLEAEVAGLSAAAPPAVESAPAPAPEVAPEPVVAEAQPEPEVPAAPVRPKSDLKENEIAVHESEHALELEFGPTSAQSSELVSTVATASLAGSSVLDDSLDTEKMMSEVTSLAEQVGDDDAGLEESLNTDKLLEEMGSMTPGFSETVAAAKPTEPAAIPAAAPGPVHVSPGADDTVYEDDLLAEFKESNDGGQG